ncbi:hypothetical protein HMPREF9946_03797 [Acetobacteraceae bacterium AT-5844]|nr:hypothetical protein HMPREF9946_03797 [Acetobacteraceae bacterium AT-5844]
MSMIVFELWHYQLGPGVDDDEIDWDEVNGIRIGLFSTKALADAALEARRYKEGFIDWPDGWRIWDCELDDAAFEDGFPGWDDGPAPGPAPRPKLH